MICDLENINQNLSNQGKSKKEIKQAIHVYLTESKKKYNPNGDLDVV